MGFKDGKYYADSEYGMLGDMGNWIKNNYKGSTDPKTRSQRMNNFVTNAPVQSKVAQQAFNLPTQTVSQDIPNWGSQADIIAYQNANGLKPDGVIGSKTMAAMKNQNFMGTGNMELPTGNAGLTPPSGKNSPSYSGMPLALPPMVKTDAQGLAAPVQPVNSGVDPISALSNYGKVGYGDSASAVAKYNQIPNNPSDAGAWGNGSWTNGGGYSNEQLAAMSPEQRIAASGQSSKLGNAFDMAGKVTGALGGAASLWEAYQNGKYKKEEMNQRNRTIASNNANISKFAANAGGSFVPA